jgi:hypothetical protein
MKRKLKLVICCDKGVIKTRLRIWNYSSLQYTLCSPFFLQLSMSTFIQRPDCTTLKLFVSEHLYRKISPDLRSIIFKSQKSSRCKQILYQKTRNKDDNDGEKYNWTYSVVQALLHQDGWHTIDILGCQSNNHQITSGSYQHNNTLTILLMKKWTLSCILLKKTTGRRCF